MLNKLYELGQNVESEGTEGLYPIAAYDGEKGAVMFTHFADEDDTPAKAVELSLSGLTGEKKVTVYLSDSERDFEVVGEKVIDAEDLTLELTAPLFGTYLITIE